MIRKLAIFLGLLAAGTAWSGDLPLEARIESAMLGDHRSPESQERNRYRHPLGTLTFLGLEDGMTVLEIWPGAGWYTEVLAPVLRHNGQFIVAGWDTDVPDQPEYRYRLQTGLLDKFAAHPDIYDQVAIVAYSPPASASLGEAESVDMVLTFRNTHGWVSGGIADSVFAEFARVLKPGGLVFGTQVTKPHPSPYIDLIVQVHENVHGFFWEQEFVRWYERAGVDLSIVTPAGVFKGLKRR